MSQIEEQVLHCWEAEEGRRLQLQRLGSALDLYFLMSYSC